MRNVRLHWGLWLASCLGLATQLGGCLVVDDDNERGGQLRVEVDLYWEEPRDGRRGPQSCESAGVDDMSFRLLDERGGIVDCFPMDLDGNCVRNPADCVGGNCLERPECFDLIEFVVDPGEYTLEADGFRVDCRNSLWRVECVGLFADRFDERYGCDVPLTEACDPVDDDGERSDADAGI